uniref:TLDc domain-containing protein n=1 Tax=Poecilia reticulata TaxID=8081 RepID=A0A3P9NJ98_POERE
MATLNPLLSRNHQRTICSQLGNVKLKLLYKASIHGFTGAAFHQRCDNQAPTVSVGYNASGYVFGGYASQPFSQTGQYVNDNQAFVFSFTGGKLQKYPCTNAPNALLMEGNSGPNFGNVIILIHGNQPVTYSTPGNYYNFNAAEMHGNDLKLTECEVYQVEGESSLMLCIQLWEKNEEPSALSPIENLLDIPQNIDF